MKPVVPKALRGYAFDRLIGVEFNDFDVERLLPSLFYITVTRGRQVAKRVNSEKDLSRYVETLSQHARMRGFMALINCWLFVYTLKLAYATNDLVARGQLPIAMTVQDAATPPEIYVDLTGERGGPSDRLAQTCVEMHLEEVRAFYQSIMLLRTLDRFLDALPPNAANAKSLRAQPTPFYFQSLINLRGNIHVEARAAADIQTIRTETAAAASGAEEIAAVDAEFDRLMSSAGPDGALGTLVQLLADAQESNGVRAIIAWFWNTGGLGKPYGLLSGNLRGNRRWRYIMGDDLRRTCSSPWSVFQSSRPRLPRRGRWGPTTSSQTTSRPASTSSRRRPERSSPRSEASSLSGSVGSPAPCTTSGAPTAPGCRASSPCTC